MSGADPYCYPGSTVLKNRLDIRDRHELDRAERRIVSQRIREGVPQGDFDLAHLKAIHSHLFQDIYEWAGELRTVELSKGGHQFQPCRYIETGAADIHGRLREADFLRGLKPHQFADRAGAIMGDLNYVHPFREGNGRTQLLYLNQLAERARQSFDLSKLRRGKWIEASRASHAGDHDAMSRCIANALNRNRSRER